MVLKTQKIMLSQMIMSLCRVMKWLSPDIVRHQMRVAYISVSLARELGLCEEDQHRLLMASLLHDMGTLALREHLQPRYDNNSCAIPPHAELGYQLIRDFRPFAEAAELIRYHHVPWDNGKASHLNARARYKQSQIIFLSGRIEAAIHQGREILGQVEDVRQRITREAGQLFVPEYVDAFLRLANREYFWFAIDSASIDDVVNDTLRQVKVELDADELIGLSKVFSHLIDFQCSCTAAHSSGVAGTAEELAKLYSFSESGCRMMMVAGYLHDIGKLVIPQEILNKPGLLNSEEFNIIKKHPFWTYQALDNITGLEEVNMWASFHHERIDSCGYPFRYRGEELPLGSRIVAVADVFTALTEDRPYRKGMSWSGVYEVLDDMVATRVLDSGVVAVLKNNFSRIDEARRAEQGKTAQIYQEFDALKQRRVPYLGSEPHGVASSEYSLGRGSVCLF